MRLEEVRLTALKNLYAVLSDEQKRDQHNGRTVGLEPGRRRSCRRGPGGDRGLNVSPPLPRQSRIPRRLGHARIQTHGYAGRRRRVRR